MNYRHNKTKINGKYCTVHSKATKSSTNLTPKLQPMITVNIFRSYMVHNVLN